MSFYSVEFIKCRKAIEDAETFEDINKAVDELDVKWNLDSSIMNDADWPKLVKCIEISTDRINEIVKKQRGILN